MIRGVPEAIRKMTVMRGYVRWTVVAVFPTFLLNAGCGTDESPSQTRTPIRRQEAALVAVVENNDSAGSEALFNANRDVAIAVIARLINVSQSELANLTLTEIVDLYLEDWMIQQLELTARNRYHRFEGLTDGTATAHNCITTIEALTRDGYLVDLIFVLHGNGEEVWFTGEPKDIRAFTGDIAARGIPIRALYQTCCYGRDMIDDWERIGITAVNGSKGLNGIVMFAPIYFLQRWTSGLPFSQAVQTGMQDEITTIRAYETQLGMDLGLIDAETIEQSEQYVGGLNPDLLWSDFSAFSPPN
jgi:hypothetical protein